MSNTGGSWRAPRYVVQEQLRPHVFMGIYEAQKHVFRVVVVDLRDAVHLYKGRDTCDLERAEGEYDRVRLAALLDALPPSPTQPDIYESVSLKIPRR